MTNPYRYLSGVIAVLVTLTVASTGRSQDAESADDPLPPAVASGENESAANDSKATPTPGDDLAVSQARLADRYKRLEEILSQLAELSAATDPNRARILRDAIAQSREQDINLRFEAIVKLLEDERLSAATNNQKGLQGELDALLELLLKADRDRELDSQRDRVREYLKELARLIRMQKGIRARTQGGDDLRSLAKDQEGVADATSKLGGEIKEHEGKTEDESAKSKKDEKSEDNKSGDNSDDESKPPKPTDTQPSDTPSSKPGDSPPSDSTPSEPSPGQGDSQPQEGQTPQDGQKPQNGPGSDQGDQQPSPPQAPADRATERLRNAQQQMQDAKKKLDEAQRDGAAERQREALAELERAKADLERILRQLREEEMERLLTQLAARFRKMLELQNAVYEGTVRLDKVAPAERAHDHEIEAAKLSRQESVIAHEAEKALLLLHEEGSSVAFPEAIEQMRGDMQQVTERLAAVKVDKITQGMEEDIIAALEETIAALEKAAKDMEKKRTPPGQQPPAGQQPEPPLVDKLAELKMIRSLQARINRQTQRYSEMIGGEQADTPELLSRLEELAKRQQRVYQATYDLSQGRND